MKAGTAISPAEDANPVTMARVTGAELLRSLLYSVLCTIGCLVLAYPLTYFIAFKAGKWKNLLLALVIVPSFTSFLIRTIAWKTILSDNGFVVHVLNVLHITNVLSAVGLTPNR